MASLSSSNDVALERTQQQAKSRLARAGDSMRYLYDPKNGPQPSHLRTRTFLRTLRYATIFLFWRLVRYAKYAAVGAIVAAVSGTVIGSIASGAAFVVAPTGIIGGASMGLIWAVAKFGFRRARVRMGKHGKTDGADPRLDERADSGHVEVKEVRMPRAEPW
jgi:hypothetical protein